MNQHIKHLHTILYENGMLASDLQDVIDNQNLSIQKKDIDFLLQRIFAGKTALFESNYFVSSSRLNLSHLDSNRLTVAGIKHDTFLPYTNGLVKLRKTNLQLIDLCNFKNHIQTTVQTAKQNQYDPRFNAVWDLIEAISQIKLYRTVLFQTKQNLQNESFAWNLLEIENEWHKQLATLFLPSNFLIELLEPALFLNSTALYIGYWIYELLRETNV